MIREKRQTKKGNYLLEVEDESNEALVIVSNKNEELTKKFNELVTDEVVLINGRVSSPFIFAEDIQFPEIPVRNEKKKTEDDISMVLTSDFHIGSNNFLGANFNKMVDWLNGRTGNERQQRLAGKIKYMMICGDNVDGIGIYPTQEKELVVKDIYQQYSLFEDFLESVPDYIHVFVIPGNHDAVRRADPQPSIPNELISRTVGKGNIHYLGNPTFVEVHGIKVLMYHGCSLDSIIATIPGMEYGKPEKPMTELLRRRNLSPIYGKNPVVPEHKDYLVIREVPDIMHVGHVHKNGYANYKGTQLINSGTWQAQTDYQAQQGHIPSPCILPIYDMKNAELRSIDFFGESLEV
jgi:DNA polymerase II small subunit